MQLGAFDDLLLPIDIPALLSRIREAFKRKKARVKAMKEGNNDAGLTVAGIIENKRI
jgi:DNA-binding NtrC family response regulator